MIEHGWPLDRLGDALAALADTHGLVGEPRFALDDPVRDTDDLEAIGAWLEHRAGLLGAELEPTYVEVGELEQSLPRLGAGGCNWSFLAIIPAICGSYYQAASAPAFTLPWSSACFDCMSRLGSAARSFRIY